MSDVLSIRKQMRIAGKNSAEKNIKKDTHSLCLVDLLFQGIKPDELSAKVCIINT